VVKVGRFGAETGGQDRLPSSLLHPGCGGGRRRAGR
jgi:hypothetical protein